MPKQVAPAELFRTSCDPRPLSMQRGFAHDEPGQADKIHGGIRVATARLALLSQTAGSERYQTGAKKQVDTALSWLALEAERDLD